MSKDWTESEREALSDMLSRFWGIRGSLAAEYLAVLRRYLAATALKCTREHFRVSDSGHRPKPPDLARRCSEHVASQRGAATTSYDRQHAEETLYRIGSLEAVVEDRGETWIVSKYSLLRASHSEGEKPDILGSHRPYDQMDLEELEMIISTCQMEESDRGKLEEKSYWEPSGRAGLKKALALAPWRRKHEKQ